jgi:hypothetical protein
LIGGKNGVAEQWKSTRRRSWRYGGGARRYAGDGELLPPQPNEVPNSGEVPNAAVAAEASNVASRSLKLFRKRLEVVEADAAGSLAGGIAPRHNDDSARERGRDAAAMVFGFSASVNTAEKKGLNGGSGEQ